MLFFFQKSMYFCFLALYLKSGPCCTCLKCIGYFSYNPPHQLVFLCLPGGGGLPPGDCLSFQLRSVLYYYCLLSFIVSSAVCSCPRWQRSVEALTGTCVFISSKDGERVKSRAESHSVLSTPLVRKLQEASQEYKFWWSIFFFFFMSGLNCFLPCYVLKTEKKEKSFARKEL